MSMIRVLGTARQACDGVTRRETLGALSLLGGGMAYGESDKEAAFIKDKPVHIRDIVATIYHCLGISKDLELRDNQDRPFQLAPWGDVIREVLV